MVPVSPDASHHEAKGGAHLVGRAGGIVAQHQGHREPADERAAEENLKFTGLTQNLGQL
jgi:hypothetical protein